jgi:hypothetical protein
VKGRIFPREKFKTYIHNNKNSKLHQGMKEALLAFVLVNNQQLAQRTLGSGIFFSDIFPSLIGSKLVFSDEGEF